ncbi:MAG: cupin domain-containing protein [Caldimicrobium sp.]
MKINLKKLDMQPHPKFPGVRIAFILTKEKSQELSITVLEIEPGIEIPVHSHEKEVDSILVLKGEGALYIEGNSYPLKEGDCVVISPGMKHGVKNTGSIPLYCYIVHAPALW